VNGVPEQVYLDAAKASWARPSNKLAMNAAFRAAVESAYHAGQLAATQERRNPGRHVAESMSGYMSPRCLDGMDGCDDRACICRCHEDAWPARSPLRPGR